MSDLGERRHSGDFSSCIKVAARNSGGTFATQPERMRERIREIFVLARSANAWRLPAMEML